MLPLHLNLSSKELKLRAEKAWKLLSPCRVCPRKCGVDRVQDEKTGFCQMGVRPKIVSYHPHFGEEACLVGTHGSGTILFSSCNLACVYCQNWEISQSRIGQEVDCQKLGEMMIELQNQGCHNINLVSPTIWVPQILKALIIAIEKGLRIPLVYNTGGYDSVETLKLLEGIIDIYMPDIKYSDNKIGLKYSLAPDYWDVVQKAVKEMFRQVGDLQLVENARSKRSAHRQVGDLVIENGLATRGLLIRHLVLPHDLAGSQKVMEFLANKISKNTYVNIMAQYRPENKAYQYSELSRSITDEEYASAVEMARKAGLSRFDKR